MKTTNLERIFIIVVSLVLNKLFLIGLIGADSMIVMFIMLALFIFNLMILGKSVDKVVDAYERSRKKQI